MSIVSQFTEYMNEYASYFSHMPIPEIKIQCLNGL